MDPTTPALSPAVAAELARLEGRVGQCADPEAQRQLAELGDAAAMRVLRDIGDSRSPVRTLSGFVRWMARNARGVPTAQSANCSSGPSVGEESVSTPRNYNEVQTPVYYNEVQDSNGEIASGLSNHAARVGSWSPNQRTPFGFQDNDYSAREIACVIPDMARMAVDSPCGRISSGFLGSQGRVEADAPVPAMASPMPNRVFVETPTRATAPAMANDIVMQVGSPAHCVPAGLHNHINIVNPIQQIISTPTRVSTPSSVRDLIRRIENMAGPSRSPPSPIWATPQLPTVNGHFAANALRGTASPQMLELEELGFRKIFMIFSYLSCNKIEDVLSVDYIRSLKFLSMTDFELKIWRAFGHKYIAATDRAKNLDSDPGMTKVYHCNVEIRGDSVVKVFKGPYIENTRTHLQNVVGDDNILMVKFMENSSTTKTDFDTYCQHYHKVAEDGIVLGLRRYHFFLYKDGGKEEKMKEEKKMEKNKKCTSPVRCYFVRTESGWSMDEPYILSGRTISQARGLFMHIQTAPTMAKYMSRFALILSKTITLDIDLSAVCVTQIDDEPCRDAHGTIVFRDGQPLIHTDGTGLISEDLAAKCPPSIYKGNFLRTHDIAANGETLMRSTSSKRHRSLMTEHPLLTQFRLFHNGLAVKGTVLVDKRLPCGTIVIRPSMIKIKTDQKLAGVRSVNSSELANARNAKKNLCGVQSVNSFEIVSTSNRPKRTLTSRFLIALLHHGQVPEEYFMGLLQNAIEGAENARRDCGDALKIAFGYADLEDSMSARMILSGIPLEEAYLQYRLAWMAQLERKGIKQGKLPIDECYYLMGTTDPTGKLGPNEVCVILENGQLSGDVLVYKHPGLHFGDIHVLKATYIRDLEKRYVGYSKYAILFPTTGPRSLADEMANSDFDGDMYWVSKNPKLLEHFKPSEPWVQQITPKKTQQKGPQDFDESQLERKLFHEFLRTRFTPSYALGTAADSWLVYMDRFLTKNVDDNEKELIKAKMVKLVDHYYLALDAPKTGDKINIEKDLMVKEYPHFMGRSYSYHSSSILGKIYDEADKLVLRQSENVEPIKISLLPCFTEREASPELMELWQKHYEEYLTDSRLLMNVPDKDERNMKFEQLYQKYKQMLYGAAELEETRRDLEDVFSEACVIYQIVYKKAESANDVGKCRFVWIVAGRALCHFYALKNDGDTAICSLPVLRKILRKDRR